MSLWAFPPPGQVVEALELVKQQAQQVEQALSVSVPKTGLLHFGPGKSFPSNFAH